MPSRTMACFGLILDEVELTEVLLEFDARIEVVHAVRMLRCIESWGV